MRTGSTQDIADTDGANVEERPTLSISPRGTAIFLALSICALIAGHLFAMYLYFEVGVARHSESERLARLVNMDGESNIPAWFSAGALLAAGVLCLIHWRVSPRGRGGDRRHWLGLALVLVFLSIDESAQIHEQLSQPLTDRFDLDEDTWRHWAWIVPYALLAFGAGLAYLRFLWRLPRRIGLLIVAAGVTFVAGAVGMELIGRDLFDPLERSAPYILSVGVEEVVR